MEVLLDPNNHYTDQTEQTQTVGVSFGRSEQKTIPILGLEVCGFEEIKSQPANLGSHAGAATIAWWGRRPASKRQAPQTENADRKTRLVA